MTEKVVEWIDDEEALAAFDQLLALASDYGAEWKDGEPPQEQP